MADDEQAQSLLASIAAAWESALLEGWVAFRAGNLPVAAVITRPDGQIIAVGRNRRHRGDGPVGHLVGTNLAHAEVNACG